MNTEIHSSPEQRIQNQRYLLIVMFAWAVAHLMGLVRHIYIEDYFWQDILFTAQGVVMISGICFCIYLRIRDGYNR